MRYIPTLGTKSVPRPYVEQYQIVPKVGLSTSGRNLGTLIVTNGFLRTSAYVIISISFAAPPKKIVMPNETTNHPSSITSPRPWQPPYHAAAL